MTGFCQQNVALTATVEMWQTSLVSLCASVWTLAVLSGCAALTNPVATGIPAGQVHPSFLAQPKDFKETMPLTFLRRQAPEVYRLAPGDVLGVYIDGVFGERGQPPPVNLVEGSEQAPSLGYPVPVRDDGTVLLPIVGPVSVDKMTIVEAEQTLTRLYTTTEPQVIKPGRVPIIVTLLRARATQVIVIRQDTPSGGITLRTPGIVRSTRELRGGAETLFQRGGGTGTIVQLPGNSNDVLTALAMTGGLPGLDAANEIVVQRGQPGTGRGMFPGVQVPDGTVPTDGLSEIIRIPLRIPHGHPLPFGPDDVILHNGDIVFIEARDTEVFYTGGLLPSGEYPLPRDYDLDVVEAVVQIGGPLVNGGINANNLSGGLIAPGIGSPSPRLLTVLRPSPKGGRMPIIVDLHKALVDPTENLLLVPGDVLILQESPKQAIARYFSQVVNLSIFSEVFARGSTSGTATVSVP